MTLPGSSQPYEPGNTLKIDRQCEDLAVCVLKAAMPLATPHRAMTDEPLNTRL